MNEDRIKGQWKQGGFNREVQRVSGERIPRTG